MRAADLARVHLRGARRRRTGDWWDALCPAHNDTHASLSFRDGDRGVVLKCQTGCTSGEIREALGLEWRDLFFEPAPATSLAPARSRIVATYDYHDENGVLLYQTVRYEPKNFRMRRPGPPGGWLWSMDDVRRVLYRLPTLKGQETVYVVEGEKDADNVRQLGLAATTNALGAGSWRDEYADQLVVAGVRRVVSLPDNDEQGELYAADVARSCDAHGLRVSVVRLPGLPAKGDVTDWLAVGRTRADLTGAVGVKEGRTR